MSRSLLYTVNSTSQILSAGDTINCGMPIRRYGCNIKVDGGTVIVDGVGYYTNMANLTFTPRGNGTVMFTIYKDGVAVPGAIGSMSVETGSTYNVIIPCAIRQTCDCESTIVIVVSGVGITTSNVAMEVIKE